MTTANTTDFGTSFASRNGAVSQIKTNALPFDYKKVNPGSMIQMSQNRVRRAPTAEELAKMMDKNTPDSFHPYSLVLWGTDKGAACNAPEPIINIDQIKSIMSAHKALVCNEILSMTPDYLLFRDETVVAKTNLYGYLMPTYEGGLIMGGQEIEARHMDSVTGRYVTPILKLGSNITHSVRFVAGKPMEDNTAEYGVLLARLQGGLIDQATFDRENEGIWHAHYAWNKYQAILSFLFDDACGDLQMGPNSWKYCRELLAKEQEYAGKPAEAIADYFNVVRGVVTAKKIYVEEKQHPELKEVGMPERVYRWGTNGQELVTAEMIATIQIGDLVSIHDGDNGPALNKGAARFWSGDPAVNKALLSKLSSEFIKNPTLKF